MEKTQSKHPKQSRLRVGIICGGQSPEHEISLQSAKNILEALDRHQFEPVIIGIDHNGGWHKLPELGHIVQATSDAADCASLLKGVDVAFPVLHGPLGEDGSMQGLLELMGLPYVGCDVPSSAIGMDKDVMKRLLRDAGIDVADYLAIRAAERDAYDVAEIIRMLGLPLFVKPAGMGSSVGVSKVKDSAGLLPAIEQALRYDRKILVEKAIVGDEVECAVLGNDKPRVSVPGRIVHAADFYDYATKYGEENATQLEIPATLTKDMEEQVRAIALKTYQTLGCEGMARIDMFVTKQNRVVVNEVNTIPGFTKFSMYPQLWQASGLSYAALITELIELAIDRFKQRQILRAAYKRN